MPMIAVYYNPSDDEATFEKRYVEEHIPLAEKFPEIKGITFAKVAQKVTPNFPYTHIFMGQFETVDAATAALTSEPMKAAIGHAAEIAPNGFEAVILDKLG